MTVQLAAKVQRSFSRSFDTYHNTTSQQAWVAEKLVQELIRLGAPLRFETGLELGCGTGHLSRLLHRNFSFDRLLLNDIAPEAEVTAASVDASFVRGDARHVEWPASVALVTSASMIQWMENPTELLDRAARALAPGGWMAVSGFGSQQYSELVQMGSTARAPGLCDPNGLAAAIEGQLEVVALGQSLRRSYFATPRDVLKHLRHTGVNGGAKKIWSKSTLARFETDYVQRFQSPQGVPLTYNPVWIIARKPMA